MMASIEVTSAGFAAGAAGVSVVCCFGIGDAPGKGVGFCFSVWAVTIATAQNTVASEISDLTTTGMSLMRFSWNVISVHCAD
jgi:hypothetical protein